MGLSRIAEILSHDEYITQWRDLPDDPLMFYKGYTPAGFAEKVFHIHVRYSGRMGEQSAQQTTSHGDWDELCFRDYLLANPETAAQYATLKRELIKKYEYDRDGYTDAKSGFIRKIVDKARNN